MPVQMPLLALLAYPYSQLLFKYGENIVSMTLAPIRQQSNSIIGCM